MFKEELAVIKEDIAVVQSKVLALEASFDVEVQSAYDKGYAEGFAKGAASVGTNKLYSQEELDKAVEIAVAKALEADSIADKEKVAQASEILNQI